MNKESKVALKVISIALIGAAIGLLLAVLFPFVRGKHAVSSPYYAINSAFSVASVFLLSALLGTYLRDYREIKARFTLGLIIFLTALLFQAIFSLPIIHAMFGFSSASLGPFSVLTNFFEVLALSVFLYLSET